MTALQAYCSQSCKLYIENKNIIVHLTTCMCLAHAPLHELVCLIPLPALVLQWPHCQVSFLGPARLSKGSNGAPSPLRRVINHDMVEGSVWWPPRTFRHGRSTCRQKLMGVGRRCVESGRVAMLVDRSSSFEANCYTVRDSSKDPQDFPGTFPNLWCLFVNYYR